jgi:uncharacterized protein (TIGR02996 family)
VTDGSLLLKAILAHPAEDTPRLVYADWLDERGETEHAAFIRKQVAGESWGRPPRQQLLRSIIGEGVCQAVFQDNGVPVTRLNCSGYTRSTLCVRGKAAVVSGAPRVIWDARTRSRFQVQRGFPHHWICSPDEFRRAAAVVFAACPIVEVSLDSKYPAHDSGSGYSWVLGDWSEGTAAHQRRLSPEIFDILKGLPVTHGGEVRRTYPTLREAVEALQFGLLVLGRRSAAPMLGGDAPNSI